MILIVQQKFVVLRLCVCIQITWEFGEKIGPALSSDSDTHILGLKPLI